MAFKLIALIFACVMMVVAMMLCILKIKDNALYSVAAVVLVALIWKTYSIVFNAMQNGLRD